MNLSDLKVILKKIDVDLYSELRPGQLQISCPLAPWFHKKKSDRHPSMGINYGGDFTIFKCFTCGESGKLWHLIDSYGELIKSQEIREFAIQVLQTDAPTLSAKLSSIDYDSPPEIANSGVQSIALDESVLENFFPFDSHPDALNYVCFERKIDFKIAKSYGLCYDSSKKRVVFPGYCDRKKLRGGVGRALDGSHPRYYNYFGFRTGDVLGGLDKWTGRDVVLVEGYFDLLNCVSWASELEYEVLCTWRADVTSEQARILSNLDKNILVMFDMDKPGESGWGRLKDFTRGAYGVKRLVWEPEMGDVGSMTKSQFMKVLKNV